MRTTLATAAFIGLLTIAPVALAQQATEQFIPIGQSPGALTMQGQLTTAAAPTATAGETIVSMAAEGVQGAVPYVVGPQTRIYVDRSGQGQPSTLGALTDLQPGRAIEVSVANAQSRTALWIKVRPAD